MSSKSFGGWLAFTLYIGAARAEANEAQLAALRNEVLPAIRDLRQRDLPPAETRRLLTITLLRVQAIMGKDWQPQGEWLSTINYMLGEANVRSGGRGTGDPVDRRRRRVEAARRRRGRRGAGGQEGEGRG